MVSCKTKEDKRQQVLDFQWRLEADAAHLKKLKLEAEKAGLEYLVDQNRVFEYVLCIDEIFTNCIIHAYGESSGNVDIHFKLNPKYLVTRIQDYGIGIPQQYIGSEPELDSDLFKETGRGLFIVNALASRLIIERGLNGGTIATIYFERK